MRKALSTLLQTRPKYADYKEGEIESNFHREYVHRIRSLLGMVRCEKPRYERRRLTLARETLQD